MAQGWLPGRRRRGRHVHRPDLHHAGRSGGPRQDADHPRRPVARGAHGHGAAGRRLRIGPSGVLRRRRGLRPRDDHGRQHHDRDERRPHRPARPPRAIATRSSSGGTTRRRSGTRPRRRPSRSPGGGPAFPSRSAATSRATWSSRSTRRRCAVACGACSQAGRGVDRRVLPVQLRQSRPRAAGPRADPRGVPRRRAHLALPRGAAPGARVRAHLDHPRQRVRGAEDHRLRRPAGREAPGGRASTARSCSCSRAAASCRPSPSNAGPSPCWARDRPAG